MAVIIVGCANAKLYPTPPEYPIVTLQIQNYCPLSIGSGVNTETYNFKDIFFYNSQSYFNGSSYVFDTDGDGLPDFFEQNKTNMTLWGISYLYADTDQNGYSDLVKVKLGIVASADGSMPICNTGITDSDSDGLTDCEEQLLGTQVGLSDTDGDGIPDGIEYRFGMDPLDPNDAYLELTGDGFTNYQKVKWGIPVATYVTPQGQLFLPAYSGPIATVNPTGATCNNPMTFNISNISILPVVGGDALQVKTVEDPQSPDTQNGTTYGRRTQFLTVIVPPNVLTGSTVIVTNGISGQTIINPNIVAPGGS